MVKHVVIWNLDERYTEEEKNIYKRQIKEKLEAFLLTLPGVVSFTVKIDGFLPQSTGEILLDSSFESLYALDNYLNHPTHKEIGKFVRSVVGKRSTVDYEEDTL